jgi:hypothetical protein
MNSDKMKMIGMDVERSLKRHRPSNDETVVVTLSLASAVINAVARNEGVTVEEVFGGFVASLAVVLDIDLDDEDGHGETLQ